MHRSQSDKIVEYLLSVLKADENAEIHACVCIGLAKLLLSGMITNTEVCLPVETILSTEWLIIYLSRH